VERSFYMGEGSPVDHTADVTAIWAKATQAIENRKAEKALAAQRAIEAATAAPNTISFNICKTLGMREGDLAGAVARVGNWNNLKAVSPGKTISLDSVNDKSGKSVPGMRITFTGGHGGDSFDASTDDKATSNDERLFNGLFDQFDGDPSVISITAIPYAKYDIYFYRFDDGDDRGGRITVNEREITIRGGTESPRADGTGYVRSSGNLQTGNYVCFENESAKDLRITYTAVDAGDRVMRHKIVGFQIVERK